MDYSHRAGIIIETQYFPTVEYLALFATGNDIAIEQYENYQKSSFRNRTVILGANGPLTLSIPLEKGKHQQTAIKDVMMSCQTSWNSLHFKSIQSAYGKSPFFLHYIDEIERLYKSVGNSLWEFNLAILKFLIKSFRLQADIHLTHSYRKQYAVEQDMRNRIKPGNSVITGEALKYEQVFSQKFGFTPGLSALDLLMCHGPYGIDVLRRTSERIQF